jgi:hypothetical protein
MMIVSEKAWLTLVFRFLNSVVYIDATSSAEASTWSKSDLRQTATFVLSWTPILYCLVDLDSRGSPSLKTRATNKSISPSLNYYRSHTHTVLPDDQMQLQPVPPLHSLFSE